MNRTIFTWAMTAAAMTGLAACASDPAKSPPYAQRDTIPLGSYPQIAPTEGLAPHLGFEQPIVEPGTPQRPMHVTVIVRSRADYALEVQYRYIFFDKLGRELRSNQGWTFKHLEPRLQTQLQGGALETAAESWRLEIRPAR
jgi:hypothetical protein